ncbi:MAG TPA: hypothetical protein PLI57_08920 [Spirochaetota bacterium]|nr:hypothetical protein [Spirochaetota bacterium]
MCQFSSRNGAAVMRPICVNFILKYHIHHMCQFPRNRRRTQIKAGH